MGCTERRVLTLGLIAFVFALSTVGAAAAPDASAGKTQPSPYPSASPAAFAERATQTSDSRAAGSFGHAVELMVLVATCGIVVALYSALDAGRGDKRVLMRIRRR
jgi:hypothetical protein